MRELNVNAATIIIFGCALLVGLGLDVYFHHHGVGIRRAVRMDMAFAFALLGLALSLVAAIGFPRNGANRRVVFSPAAAKSAIDRLACDPMYLGLNALYVAVCLVADRPIALALLPIALVIHFGLFLRKYRPNSGR